MREPCSRAVAEVPQRQLPQGQALALPPPAGPVPKLLLALVQGMGPDHPHAGVKCLGGAAASFPPFLSPFPFWGLQIVPSFLSPIALFHVVIESS